MISWLTDCRDNFNPRSREGSDDIYAVGRPNATLISIHAPARGATILHHHPFQFFRRFQSTLPRGERRTRVQNRHCRSNFNPRSREGSDGGACAGTGRTGVISIHAPARGATAFIDIFSFTVRLYFISSH